VKLECWNCGHDLDDVPRPISRHATCSVCFNELHCCRLCRHYDEQRTTQCFEDRADPPINKDNANFCDFFAPRAGAFEPQSSTRSGNARGELDALFGGSAPDATPADQADPAGADDAPSEEELARRKLDDLFK